MGKRKGYDVYLTLPLEVVLKKLCLTTDQDARASFEGCKHAVKVGSARLVMYKVKGTKCVNPECHRHGVEWRIESNGSAPHLNLYCADGVMMTKDHVVPKSKGGPDVLDNFQPMCARCNERKGDELCQNAKSVTSHTESSTKVIGENSSTALMCS